MKNPKSEQHYVLSEDDRLKSTVSIVIPCYRQAHFLPTAIDSVVQQSYPAIEIIVVNDGSDDNTDEVAASYGDRIHYVRKQNGGLPSARNAGIAVATGKYLHFLDSDDSLHPEAITWLVEAMDGCDNRLCVMGYHFFSESPDNLDGKSGVPPMNGGAVWQLLTHNLAPPNAFLAATSAVRAVGAFDERLKSCEDWDLWCRLVLAKTELVVVPKIGAHYRRYSGSMSTNGLRMAQSRAEVLLRVLEELRHRPEVVDDWAITAAVLRRVLRKRVAEECFDAGFLLRNQGQFRDAVHWYVKSVAQGRWSWKAVSGLAKLIPYKLLRGRQPA